MPRIQRPEPVTVARMPEPTVRYRSRSTAAPAEAAFDQPETRGVVASGVPVSQLLYGDTSPGSWGPHIADEDLDLVIRRLSPVEVNALLAGCGSKPMADMRGTKRPTGEDRRERLVKMANLGKGKGKAGTSAPPSQNVVPPATRATPAPSAPRHREGSNSDSGSPDQPTTGLLSG
ncbi:hypothetical protein TIFTF001_054670 [Ficus carica]|uniref:Uncharacterized protein n=1 Tax=Ficus carica TaxID=3494 RepID=A0AA88EC46_FICCA|nr:hypothetical protein TIFTF001_054670 [Ficus carica]